MGFADTFGTRNMSCRARLNRQNRQVLLTQGVPFADEGLAERRGEIRRDTVIGFAKNTTAAAAFEKNDWVMTPNGLGQVTQVVGKFGTVVVRMHATGRPGPYAASVLTPADAPVRKRARGT